MFTTGIEARKAIRSGKWTKPTSGLLPGYVQANLVILPEKYAVDFFRFCIRNPKPCPILDVLETGNPYLDSSLVQKLDIRTDVPLYRIYENGQLHEESPEIKKFWKPDFVTFLLGCSFTFEQAMIEKGIPVRHIENHCNVPMFRTNRKCRTAGIFQGPLVVSMRPIPASQITDVVRVTSRYPAAHGAPVHVGSPETLGIHNLDQPDYGDPVPILSGEIPVFWACGVTPQAVAQTTKIPHMVTHAPGYMLVTDKKNTGCESIFV